MKKYKIGIIGAGKIAAKMAHTIAGMEEAECYAIASRNQQKADEFAQKWGFRKAYGSYEAMVNDPDVNLIYVATPHNFHFEHASLCLRHYKPVLCEKAFTGNARQAEQLFALAKEQNTFITEAIWTRYLPLSATLKELVDSGIIGTPYMIAANLGYPIKDVERVKKPELAGGALLDLGVYALNFAAMLFGTDVKEMYAHCIKAPSGVDAQTSITQIYPDNRMALLACSMYARTDKQGIISGDCGQIIVEDFNHPQSITVYDNNYQPIKHIPHPPHITGYEYEVRASIEAIEHGWLESPYMPHVETIRIMKQMDEIRRQLGIVYPFD